MNLSDTGLESSQTSSFSGYCGLGERRQITPSVEMWSNRNAPHVLPRPDFRLSCLEHRTPHFKNYTSHTYHPQFKDRLRGPHITVASERSDNRLQELHITPDSATMDPDPPTAIAPSSPPIWRWVLSFLAVGACWGLTVILPNPPDSQTHPYLTPIRLPSCAKQR